MASTLQSPGVQVSVVDESFYTPATPGTVPLIFVASAQDKTNPSGVTAPGTTAAKAGQIYLLSSQRDLTDNFGVPHFYTDAANNPINGGEQNEYGLQAAYSLLGVSSAAYVVRAPVDLSLLTANASVPTGDPADYSYWLDTSSTSWGIFEWDGSVFNSVNPIVIDNTNYAQYTTGDAMTPSPAIGKAGDYAVVSIGDVMVGNATVEMNMNQIWYKNSDGVWVVVGSVGETWTNNVSHVWATSHPLVVGVPSSLSITTSGSISINGHSVTFTYSSGSPGALTDVAAAINGASITGVHARVIAYKLCLFADADATSDGTDPDGKIVINSSSNALMTNLGLKNGTYYPLVNTVAPHTQYPDYTDAAVGSVYVKTTSPNGGQIWQVKQWNPMTGAWAFVSAPVYPNAASALYNVDKTGGGANIPVGTVYVESNFDHGNNGYYNGSFAPTIAEFALKVRTAVAPTTITGGSVSATITSGTLSVSVTEPGVQGYTAYHDIAVPAGTGLTLVTAINNAGITNLTATPNADGTISISHTAGGDIRFKNVDKLTDANFVVTATTNLYMAGEYETDGTGFVASNWAPLAYTASSTQPSSSPADGTLWYDAALDQVDIMVHDGTKWRGYREIFPATDPMGPIVSASKPTTQQDGKTALANGDIWISLANGADSYGQDVYVWDGNKLVWVAQDLADHTSPTGWLFADARWATSGQATDPSAIADLLLASYVDPDAPDPVEYPRGMKLWNLRRSGFNVKQYMTNFVDINANGGYNIRVPADKMNNPGTSYNPNRWVSVSPNNTDGTGSFGRLAQRAYVVKSLKSEIDSNTEVRDTDRYNFNLIVCPGYPEVLGNLCNLNTDRGQTAFVIGDTPFRLAPDATSLANYGNNVDQSLANTSGLTSQNDYLAVYYPSGLTNDLSGNNIVVPPSHMMMRTYALSDQQSYPWFAPAGIRRGVVDNAVSVGYLDANGNYNLASLPESIRNVMATAKINPIATFTGAGLVAYGQYTRAPTATALDRVNVARLVAYLRRQLDILSRPFLFEPNDKITRDELKNAAQSLLLELVGHRAIYDFIVVCDESNNTPARINRSELWMDIAIEPTKAVEFIYIPLRLVGTGTIKSGTFTTAA